MTDAPQRDSFRQFLDNVQYSRNGILRYEKIFGPGFVSTGGIDTTKVCVQLLDQATGLAALITGRLCSRSRQHDEFAQNNTPGSSQLRAA